MPFDHRLMAQLPASPRVELGHLLHFNRPRHRAGAFCRFGGLLDEALDQLRKRTEVGEHRAAARTVSGGVATLMTVGMLTVRAFDHHFTSGHSSDRAASEI